MQVDYKYIAIDTLSDMAQDSKNESELKEKMSLGDMLYSCLRDNNSGLGIPTKELAKLRQVSDKRLYEIFEKARKYEQGE